MQVQDSVVQEQLGSMSSSREAADITRQRVCGCWKVLQLSLFISNIYLFILLFSMQPFLIMSIWAWHWRLMPTILAIQEAELRRIKV
jgi:hypothetical protein